MSRIARTDFIEWMENQDHEELVIKFSEYHKELFDDWLYEQFEASRRE